MLVNHMESVNPPKVSLSSIFHPFSEKLFSHPAIFPGIPRRFSGPLARPDHRPLGLWQNDPGAAPVDAGAEGRIAGASAAAEW